jgi:NADH-quinone oxidoreductase subunit L
MMQEFYVIIPMLISSLLALLMKGRDDKIRYIALAMSAISFILSVLVVLQPQTANLVWFNVGQLSFQIQTAAAGINLLLLFLVSAVNVLIMGYSFGFMDRPSEQPRYYFLLSLFAASMMLFAISASFITLLVAWEGLGITSYLLIGFWYWRPEAAAASRKSITTIVIGDVFLIAAIAIIASSYHTLSIQGFIGNAGSSGMTLPLILILIAALTKSAQLPFSEWLPDAMEGPTPVSAFLHSSTMVKAGVFLVALLLPAFRSADLLWLILLIGIASALYGALNALTETHIKRILAYSTIEEMGLMFVALGLGSVPVAMLLFVVQTFYKVLLFMLAGVAMRTNNGEEQINKIYGFATGRTAAIALVIGAMALAGIFPLAGFFGKFAISALPSSYPIYILLIIVQFISSIYITRWAALLLRRPKGQDRTRIMIEYKTLPRSMVIIIIAAAAAVLASSMAYQYIPTYLGGKALQLTYFGANAENAISVAGIVIVWIAASVGALSVWKGRFKNPYLGAALNAVYSGIVALSRGISFVAHGIEIALNKIVAHVVRLISLAAGPISKLENGKMNTYMIAFILGIVIIIAIFVL